ncbi:hypothetical protein ACC713_20345 [Rhizobium johnstonii]|uniref:hypothetical protein n=1 Tax=Rhizobium johnstonii TaxID=3019933 RepID=UPI003F980D36
MGELRLGLNGSAVGNDWAGTCFAVFRYIVVLIVFAFLGFVLILSLKTFFIISSNKEIFVP